VLTAGHCSLDRTFQVRVGSKDAQEGLTYEIVNVYQYSRFSRGQAGDPVNDVKIVEISNTDRTLGVNAVTLNTNPSFPSLDTTVTVSGYGRTSSSGEVAGHLRSVTVPIVGYESCHSRYRDMTNMMNICAGSLGLDSCQGDSGSGLWTRTLSVMNQSQVTLVGVVSGPVFTQEFLRFRIGLLQSSFRRETKATPLLWCRHLQSKARTQDRRHCLRSLLLVQLYLSLL
jgi:secreted trypsin-like serine protease